VTKNGWPLVGLVVLLAIVNLETNPILGDFSKFEPFLF
jgi:hypothetical protein